MLTVRKIADKTGLTVCRVRQLIYARKLKAKMVDGIFKVSANDFRAFLRSRVKIRVCKSDRLSKRDRLGKPDKRFKVIK